MRRHPSSSSEDDGASKSIPTAGAAAQKGEANGEIGNVARDKDPSRLVETSQTQPPEKKLARDGNSRTTASGRNMSQWFQNTSSGEDTVNTTQSKSRLVAMAPHNGRQLAHAQSRWSCSLLTLITGLSAITLLTTVLYAFIHHQQDPKGCHMSYMMPMFARFSDFDTEHTRFASKYSLYLYREGGVDEDTRVKGIPVIFIPGNAGSYKQVRPIAAEAATYFHNVLREDSAAVANGKRALDFFSVDFNEDITAFHGQTLLDQAEYLNEAVAYILGLYHIPNRSLREAHLPEPKSVIIVGHSMGGIVARAMLRRSNYQENSINTIITLSAPHARPPVSFDADMVSTYKDINNYWRESYSNPQNATNPLSDLTLVSVAGGGLDTMVPSEYTSLTSLVPDTHGFTVFTSSIPTVWTGMDHLAIMWCDQFRKALIKAIFDVVDARRRSQTRPQNQRIQAFRKRLLTGMEPVVEKASATRDSDILLLASDSHDAFMTPGDRLTLRSLGQTPSAKLRLMSVPAKSRIPDNTFTLLTDQVLGVTGESGLMTVLLCRTLSPHSSQHFAHTLDLTDKPSTVTKLACKSAAQDVSYLPASTNHSTNAFDDTAPFSYLQYDHAGLSAYDFIAILDNTIEASRGWVIAEFSRSKNSEVVISKGHHQLLMSGMHITLPASRPMMTELKIPEIHSTLFAYNLDVHRSLCNTTEELFAPLLRQYIAEPYESKFFVNTHGGNINVHGISPYMPPPLQGGGATDGLSLQLWTDPACNSTIELKMTVDKLGSVGRLVMRYRTVFAALPLLVILIVIRKQFKVYDRTGIFISFSESMDQCIRTSLPFMFMALTFLSISLSKSSSGCLAGGWFEFLTSTAQNSIAFDVNDLMLGTQDPFLWFLVPLFGVVSVGLCIAGNYLVVILMFVFSSLYGSMRATDRRSDSTSRSTRTSFVTATPYQRLITTGTLLLLVSTLVPYQFAYMVLAIVQLITCVRALRVARDTELLRCYNFYNYAHSIFVLMLWILPINMPVLIVWIHNLAVHWMTPFSTHHNLLAVLPIVLLVEVMSTGNMLPRTTSRLKLITNALTFLFAVYAAVYGVTYAYRLHYLFNFLAMWLLIIHITNTTTGSSTLLTQSFRLLLDAKNSVQDARDAQSRDTKKTP